MEDRTGWRKGERLTGRGGCDLSHTENHCGGKISSQSTEEFWASPDWSQRVQSKAGSQRGANSVCGWRLVDAGCAIRLELKSHYPDSLVGNSSDSGLLRWWQPRDGTWSLSKKQLNHMIFLVCFLLLQWNTRTKSILGEEKFYLAYISWLQSVTKGS